MIKLLGNFGKLPIGLIGVANVENVVLGKALHFCYNSPMKPKIYVETSVINNLMNTDPIVEEVRKAQQQHAAQFNYDLQAIYEDLKRQEATSGHNVVTFPPRQRCYTRLTPKIKPHVVASTTAPVLD